jgi:hypothetical protein
MTGAVLEVWRVRRIGSADRGASIAALALAVGLLALDVGLLSVPIVSGRAGPNISELQKSCAYDTGPIAQSWPCIKQGMMEHQYEGRRLPGDVYQLYVATGDLVVERLQHGKMTEAEGKTAMAQARVNANNATAQRNASMSGGVGPIVCNIVAGTTICY